MGKERIPWIDVAKGCTIILMVAGHSSLPDGLQRWIFSFHMPLFFILSGMTTNMSVPFKVFAIRKLIGLGVPFAIYSIICAIIVKTLDLAPLSWNNGWGDFALWFVPILFLALIVARIVLMAHRTLRWILVLGLPLISAVLCYFKIIIGWSLTVVPYATFFVVIGYFSNSLNMRLGVWKWVLLGVSLALSMVISRLWPLDMAHNLCIPIVPLTLGAVAGSVFMCQLSRIFDRYFHRFSAIMQSVGRETFIILAFSQIFIMTLNKYFEINSILKYLILFAVLLILKYLKDFAINYYKSFCKNY